MMSLSCDFRRGARFELRFVFRKFCSVLVVLLQHLQRAARRAALLAGVAGAAAQRVRQGGVAAARGSASLREDSARTARQTTPRITLWTFDKREHSFVIYFWSVPGQ